MAIKVLLADDHTVVRAGIRSIIEHLGKDIIIVGEASNGREVLEMAEQDPADVYIMDIAMPLLNGIETMSRLLKMQPGAKVLVLSMYDDKIHVQRVIKAGARGYILKESASEEILHAIGEVYKGKFYLSPSLSEYLVEGFLNAGSEESISDSANVLTSRQREILRLVCEGLTEKDIAAKLNISPYTVHVHKNNIMKALGIHTTAGLIRYGIKEGICQI